MIPRLDSLVDAVQANCDIADARHAGDLTLCHYLLEMREFFRWEHGMALTEQPPREAVGRWISAREALWESLEHADYAPLAIGDRAFDAFDADGVNAALSPHGLVYGAGIGRFGKPHFYLGLLERAESRDGVRILVAGCEYARDLSTVPAALREGTMHVRQESLRRWLWERFETWCVKKPEGALKRALDAYGFESDASAALERMTAAETETVILHELGEHRAGEWLGEAWASLIAGIEARRAEMLLRALRDNLADCLVTLPVLLDRGAAASLHFWFANFEGLRRELFPQLAASYEAWLGGNAQALRATLHAGRAHWRHCCARAINLGRDHGTGAAARIEALIEDRSIRL